MKKTPRLCNGTGGRGRCNSRKRHWKMLKEDFLGLNPEVFRSKSCPPPLFITYVEFQIKKKESKEMEQIIVSCLRGKQQNITTDKWRKLSKTAIIPT